MSDSEKSRVVPLLGDLLMGAAYADKQLDGREGDVVRAKLATWLEVDEISDALRDHLDSFDPDTFDMEMTASMLKSDDEDQARAILELVVAVNEADDEIDFAEDEYLRNLAAALGVEKSNYEELTLEILSVEDLREGLRGLAAKPPPIPED